MGRALPTIRNTRAEDVSAKTSKLTRLYREDLELRFAPRTALGVRHRALLETLYATSIRYLELARLTPYDVDTQERILRVIQGKGRKDRNVPLTRAACHAIEDYLVHGRPNLVKDPKVRHLFL